MIKNPLNPGILFKKYFGKLLLGLTLTALLMPASAGRAFALGYHPDGQEIAQQRVITGQVTERNGTLLPSVSILEKGTTNGVLTDANGQFRINVTTADPVLVFSFVGYETTEIAVGTRAVINVTLATSTIGLDEIVVVGYGTVRKSDVTGSITSVDVDKIRDVPAATVVKALQGKTAGVEIQNIGRQPGAGSQIRIRGSRSLSGSNDPLIIVDGIPFGGNLSDIASDDIAGLEVLKDASATAIYGSRGSNGVIIISTRKGESGAIRVNYNGY